MDALVVALATAIAAIGGSVGSRLVDRYFARKDPLRQELFDELTAVAQARRDRIEQLEADLAVKDGRIGQLERDLADESRRADRLEERVRKLEAAIVGRLADIALDLDGDPS